MSTHRRQSAPPAATVGAGSEKGQVAQIEARGASGEAFSALGKLVIIGVDPGLGGAWAVLPPNGRIGVYDVPTVEVKKGGRTRREYAIPSLALELARYRCKAVAVIEQVSPRPGEGVSSAFSFGRGVGMWEGLLIANCIPIRRVTPAVWKKAMGCVADKGATRLRAMEAFPAASFFFDRVKDADRAEAALLALYGRRLWTDALTPRPDAEGKENQRG